MGLLGFNAALVGACVAAQTDLGRHWWWPIVGLGVSALASVFTFAAGANVEGGPNPADFYAIYGGLSAAEANVLLLRDLAEALRKAPIRRKETAWSVAFYVLVFTVAAGIGLFAF